METAAAAANSILFAAFERAANAFLDLDPDAKQKLIQLRGEVFCIEITAPPVKFYLRPSEDGIVFDRECAADEKVAVTLRGSLAAFAKLARASRAGNAHAASAFGGGQIQFHGDAELAQTFQKILAEFDLDLEELLSHRIGDMPARQAARAAHHLKTFAEESFMFARENTADYLTEEKHAAVSTDEAGRLRDEIETMRADVDRLSSRVQRLRRELERRAAG